MLPELTLHDAHRDIFLPWKKVRMLAWLFGFLCLFAADVLQAQGASERDDWVTQRYFLDDPSGALTFADVQGRQFTEFAGLLSRGNSDRALWLRLQVAPHERQDLVLLVQPAHLKQVDVYSQDTNGQWVTHTTGTSVAYSQRPSPEINFVVRLAPQPEQSSTVYVRLKSPTAMIPFARVVSLRSSIDFDTKLHMGLAAYTAVGLLFSCISLVAWKSSGDRLWLFGALFDVTSVCMACTHWSWRLRSACMVFCSLAMKRSRLDSTT
jgi:hypothetical protein